MNAESGSPAGATWLLLPTARPRELARLVTIQPGPDDRVIAVDGGAMTALSLGWSPHVLVGDLDSCPADVVAEMERTGTRVERHLADKDQTDLELALALAAEPGAVGSRRCWVVGGGGGRMDHLLANAAILSAPRGAPARTTWIAEEAVTEVLEGPLAVRLEVEVGQTLTLLARGAPVEGLDVAGVKWPLDDDRLVPGSGRGVSNLATGPVTISLRSSVLMVIAPRTD